MKLVKYNPLNDFVPSTFGGMIEQMLNTDRQATFYPAVDIIKNEKSIELSVFAPGMNKEDFELNVEENMLTISGERKLNEDLTYSLRESQYGSFTRTFKLNDSVETEGIKAKYENGVLKIELPVLEKKEQKQVIKID